MFGEWTDNVTLVPGAGGAFEVTVNDKLIYSKKAAKKFPETNDLKDMISKFLE
jgi:selT/selW/selH-like putative selenoprotein